MAPNYWEDGCVASRPCSKPSDAKKVVRSEQLIGKVKETGGPESQNFVIGLVIRKQLRF